MHKRCQHFVGPCLLNFSGALRLCDKDVECRLEIHDILHLRGGQASKRRTQPWCTKHLGGAPSVHRRVLSSFSAPWPRVIGYADFIAMQSYRTEPPGP